MTPPTVAPFGHWPSPITAAAVAAGARRLGLVAADGGWVYWIEGRPDEGGRQVIMRGRPGMAVEDLLPKPYSARSRVHEYGGGDFLVVGGTVYFVADPSQALCSLVPGRAPEEVVGAEGVRIADMAHDARRSRLICIAERAGANPHRPENLIAAVALKGTARGRIVELAEGHDFYAFARPSPDGTRLAYLAWDLPDMPWDQAGLYVAPFTPSGRLGTATRIAGGDGAAAMEPLWLDDRRLAFASDRSGRGRIEVWDGDTVRPLAATPGEIGRAMWSLAVRSFVALRDGTIVASCAVDGAARLVRIDTRSGAVERLAVDAVTLDGLAAAGEDVAGLVGRAAAPAAVALVTPGVPAPAILRAASDIALAPEAISRAEPVAFAGGDGSQTHAFLYRPASITHRGPAGASPPAIVLAHGGPTGATDASLKLRVQFFTSRGFVVCDVNYAGSTGFGRAYRDRLAGRWGIADVADCAAAARHLAGAGLADPRRIAIAGGSAGGYTVLMALATTDVFAAGSSHYGISDPALLLRHTHKFESGYLHRLMGTTARRWRATFAERSPIAHADAIRAPLILFQGLDDRIVPPEQSRLMAQALRKRGITVALHEFAGEGHGFRRAETITAVLEAELAFLQAVLAAG